MNDRCFTLTIRCPERRGIVAAVSSFLADRDCSIIEAAQYRDSDASLFFMRVFFEEDGAFPSSIKALSTELQPVVERFSMEVALHAAATKRRVLILVSKFGHCLHDLLHRWREGQLPIEVVGVVSNHDDLRSFTEWNGLPYHHLPVDRASKHAQEGRIIELIDRLGVDLVVLARYMQVLSPNLCDMLAGRCINIHHSFLPSFKGARPYHQAHARGVKVIGATAHYVTTALDEGPIIEQDTRRVSHARSAEDLVVIGQEVECTVLARAVRWHAEHRVLLNGQRTVVFD